VTEQEWLASQTSLTDAVEFVAETASMRKLRLFGAACAQRRWRPMGQSGQWASHLERIADASPSPASLASDWREVWSQACAEVFNPLCTSVNSIAEMQMEEGDQELGAQWTWLHDIFGNPFQTTLIPAAWLAWNDGACRKMAQAIYDDRAFARLPLLADELEDAGCDNAEILAHCRGQGEHVRGCWVVDLLLGKSCAAPT
jgi:hypothetical protein